MATPTLRAVKADGNKPSRPGSAAQMAAVKGSPYHLRISRLTVDKLGVKLYDKASAVVAELIANGYDADAETVTVRLPLNLQLASQAGGKLKDLGYAIDVEDDGHGMTPEEAIGFYLRVGADRRTRRGEDGTKSRKKKRPVMGRKGIGKLAPFGICRRIEVWSAGGPKTKDGYAITHFFMDFDKIVTDDDEAVPLEVGDEDRGWSKKSGTRIRLTSFLAKRVPDQETFLRQLAVRFTFAKADFKILIVDTANDGAKPVKVNPLEIPLIEGTRVDLSDRPVFADDGTKLLVSGWLGMAVGAYKNEEMTGVRIYARGKIVGMTRDFNQPAGFTGEFAMRSYLVGEVQAEWLDLDSGDDLVRTDRQDILWSSDYGELLRRWGAELIREIAGKSREPRRVRVRDEFLRKSGIEERARERFGDKQVARVAIDLAKKFGGFAAEDELGDDVYVEDLSQIILSVAPHQALMEAFHEFANQVTKGAASIDQMLDIFSKAQIAELASYAQIAAQRVRVIKDLQQIIDVSTDESQFQALIAQAPWLIEPSWTVITKNQSLKNFKHAFEKFWKRTHGTEVVLAIDQETKRPDFTLVSIDGLLHVVEIKKSGHFFDDTDFDRLINYVDAFEQFFKENKETVAEFYRAWRIDLVADGEKLKKSSNRHAFGGFVDTNRVKRMSWQDFLSRAKKVHEQFLDVHDLGAEKRHGEKGMSRLRAVSLFSNCGAGDVGYRDAGFRFDVMAELDPRRLDVCVLNHPGAEGVPGDLRKTWQTVIKKYRARAGQARPALLCACPPCQGMSSARSGKGSHDDAEAGSKDERNLLVTVIANVALKLKPSLIVVENVPAFFTRKVHHPKDKKPVSAANYLITSLAEQYVAFPLVADLCDFGVPQSRNRAFLTFVRKDLPGLAELMRIARTPFPRATHTLDVGNAPPVSLAHALASFALPDLDSATPEAAQAKEYDGFHSVPVWDERTYAMVAAIPGSTGRSAWDNDICHHCGPVSVSPETVTCPECSEPLLRPIVQEDDGSYRLVKGFKSSYRRMYADRPAATVTTASGHIGSDYTIHPTQNRLLSPLECSLLQTFPNDFKWGDALKKLGHTNVREMIGEAVPPAFTKLHGEVLYGILKREWARAPMALSDERITKGWTKLAAASKKDGRNDPRDYFDYAKPAGHCTSSNKRAGSSAPTRV